MSYAMGSLIAVVIGAALDLLLGDPQTAWHPICLVGYLIAFVEKVTRKLFPKTKTGSVRQVCFVQYLSSPFRRQYLQ